MKTIRIIILFCTLLISVACSDNIKEKYQTARDNTIHIKNKVIPFDTGDVLIGSVARLYVADNYLIVADYKSLMEQIHIFGLNDYKHLVSTAYKGLGPEEITGLGHIVYDDISRNFYVSDHGKQKIFSYNIDSLIENVGYCFKEKVALKNKQFPAEYFYINDSLCIARVIEPTGNSGFNESLGKWNMLSGAIKTLDYRHPEVKKRRITFTVSPEESVYIECYLYHDLMTICKLNGASCLNIYGPNWDNTHSNKTVHFGKVIVCKDKIIASYSGGRNFSNEELPDKLIVFKLNGDYIKTLDIGYRINDFCYDSNNNKLIFIFNDIIQFGFLNLQGLVN